MDKEPQQLESVLFTRYERLCRQFYEETVRPWLENWEKRMKPKNPHAVALGRKGGKATGKPKGFAAMDPEKADKIRKLAARHRKLKNGFAGSLYRHQPGT